jgi:PIN domain nuclease of toxin-antitoxin system
MAADAIVDTSAVLAFVFNEPGGAAILEWRSALICAVNHAEVVGKMIDQGADDMVIDLTLRRVSYRVEPLDEHRAAATARLRRIPLAKSLSLGDRACLSLAMQTGLPVLTADRAWSELELGVDVRLIR